MQNSKKFVAIILSVLLFVTLIGCTKKTEKTSANSISVTKTDKKKREPQKWNLYVAAGLKKPMDVVVERFEAKTGDDISVNYSSSGALFVQIEKGQPCDLYFTADWLYAKKLQDKGLCDKSDKFLNDKVVLVVSEKAKNKIKSIKDLSKPGITVAICDEAAPVGDYSQKGLENLKLWDSVEKNVVSRPTTVNQAAIMVKEDQVDATLIYSSVANGNKLKIVDTIDTKHTGEIIFGIVKVKGGNSSIAKEFTDFIMQEENVKEFTKFGWTSYEK